MSKFSLDRIDRRIVYILVFLALGIPLTFKYAIPPARMSNAEKIYDVIENTQFADGEIAFVAMDYGPNLIAENGVQAEVVVEHLMRRRIKFAVFSIYSQAEPFLTSVPEGVASRLMKEMPGERWEYGKDWVNLGFRPGGFLILQSIPKSEDLATLFEKDSKGNNLRNLPAFRGVKGLESIKILAQFTGLVGVLDTYIAFFQKKDYRPIFVHGCTSITIPEAYIYLDSGQLKGLFEGIAGAAWYSELLKRKFSDREIDSSAVINTGLGIAHLVIILLIVVGNIATLRRRTAKA